MERMMLSVDGVPTLAVWVARRFRDRLRGLIGRPSGSAIVLPGASVHGWGMRRRIIVAGVAPDGTVIDVRVLRPFRFLRVPGAVRILELPAGAQAPPVGATVSLGFVRCQDA